MRESFRMFVCLYFVCQKISALGSELLETLWNITGIEMFYMVCVIFSSGSGAGCIKL